MDDAFEKEVWKAHPVALAQNEFRQLTDMGSDAEALNTYPSVFQTAPISSLQEQSGPAGVEHSGS